MNRRQRLTRGAAGLGGLLVALGGVPVVLVVAGQAPPGRVPSLHQVANALQRPISDSALLRAATLLCWLLWLAFAVAVFLELAGQVSRFRRRDSGRSWPGVPGLERLAAALIVAAMLLLPQRVGEAVASTGGTSSALTGPAFHPASPSHEQPSTSASDDRVPIALDRYAGLRDRPDHAAPGQHAGPATTHRYVVQRYDSPWAIAERYLGDGTRWRELRDGQGRPLVEDSPSRHRRYPARLIHPGEVLLLPHGGSGDSERDGRWSTAQHVAGPPARTGRPGPGAITTQAPGSGRAANQEPDGRPAGPPVAGHSAAAAPVAGRSATAPHAGATAGAAEPGSGPAGSGRAGRSHSSGPAGAGAAGGSAPSTVGPGDAPLMERLPPLTSGGQARLDASGRQETSGHRSGPTADLVGAGLLGAAVLGTVGALRRRQARLRPAGRRIRLPEAGLAQVEAELRTRARPDRAQLVDRAVHHLAAALRRSADPLPVVLGLIAGPDHVEVLLERPAPPPLTWTASSEGFRWRMPADEVPELPPQQSAPLPALAPLGRAAASQSDVFVNLEAAGVLSVCGEMSRARGLIQAVAVNLSGSSWAGATDLILLGFGDELAPTGRSRTATSFAEIAEELGATARVMASVMADHGCSDPFHGRVRDLAGDGWPPAVVLCAQPISEAELAFLSQIATPGSGVVAVVPNGNPGARWAVDVSVSPIPVDPLRLAIEPAIVDAGVLADLGRLLAIATDVTGACLEDPPYNHVELTVERPGPSLTDRLTHLSGSGPPAPPVLVRVLGPVEVEGAAEFKRAKARELVVYLAMHPRGVGEAELDEALWPSEAGRVVPASTRDSTVSVARTAIGGPSRLLPAHGQGSAKRYRLSSAVQSDWRLFCDLHRSGRQERSAAALHQALDLIRGRPFEGVVAGRAYGWVHTEGHARHIEAEVADAAEMAAGLFLEAQDPAQARWAARQGLSADPYAERLWVRLMEAADLLGESQEVERIMDEMDTVLELEGDFSALHPNTLAAYDRLSRRRRHPTG